MNKYKYEYYNFKNGNIKVGACLERNLELMEIPFMYKETTLQSLVHNVNAHTRDYKIYIVKDKSIDEVLELVKDKKAFFIFQNKDIFHLASWKNNTYYDTQNLLLKTPLSFVMILG